MAVLPSVKKQDKKRERQRDRGDPHIHTVYLTGFPFLYHLVGNREVFLGGLAVHTYYSDLRYQLPLGQSQNIKEGGKKPQNLVNSLSHGPSFDFPPQSAHYCLLFRVLIFLLFILSSAISWTQ